MERLRFPDNNLKCFLHAFPKAVLKSECRYAIRSFFTLAVCGAEDDAEYILKATYLKFTP